MINVNQLIMFATFVLFLFVFFDIYRNLIMHKTGGLEIIAPDEQKKKFKLWMTEFDKEAGKAKARGDKALANPFDSSECGIPQGGELVICRRMIAEKGFHSYINPTIVPEHLTVILE